MPNPTDTNQASEELIREFRQGSEARHYGNRHTPDGNERVEMIPLEWAIEVTSALIRTEKLKLLAEVRERVVGENFKNWGELDTDEQATKAYANRLKADQRAELTKLEAEL